MPMNKTTNLNNKPYTIIIEFKTYQTIPATMGGDWDVFK